ncbi:MAG: hypothetical protein QM571_02605 [Micrococcaceae bacterium]
MFDKGLNNSESLDSSGSEVTAGGRGVSRRSVAKGAAWSVPVVATAVSVPAQAASACDPSTYTINFLPVGSVPAPGYSFPDVDGLLSVQVTAPADCPAITGNVVLTVTSSNANFTTKDTGPNTVTIALNGAGIATFGTANSGNPLFLACGLKPGDSVTVHAQIEGTSVETSSGGNGDDMQINIGNLYGWGTNSYEGNGTGHNRNVPVQVGANNPKTDWANISASNYFSLAMDSTNDLYAIGYNGYGQLGLGDTTARQVFTQVPAPSGGGSWVSFCTGFSFSLALSSTGELYASGRNDFGQLGLGDTTNRDSFTQVPFPDGVTSWKSVSVGDGHSLALSSTGTLYATGHNIYGQIALDSPDDYLAFTKVTNIPEGAWTIIYAAGSTSFIIDSNGVMYGTGVNSSGELGLGDTTNRDSFTQVAAPSGGGTWTGIESGGWSSLALSSTGDLYATGVNSSGELGLGDTTNRDSFTQVAAPSGESWTNNLQIGYLSASGYTFQYSLVLGSSGILYATGDNQYGELGLGDATNRNVFTALSGCPNWKQVTAGSGLSLGIMNS